MLATSFIVLTCLFLLCFYQSTGRDRQVLLVSLGWMILVSILALQGFFRFTYRVPPPQLLMLVGSLGLVSYLFSRLRTGPFNRLVAWSVHGLRLGVEWILYALAKENLVPDLMTFRGWNFDVLVGASAILLLGWQLSTGRKLKAPYYLIWNLLGLVFLSIVVGLAVLSVPSPLQQLAFDEPNLAVLQFPYVLLPAFIVQIVFLTHFLAIIDTWPQKQ